jgi:hypothetical protein
MLTLLTQKQAFVLAGHGLLAGRSDMTSLAFDSLAWLARKGRAGLHRTAPSGSPHKWLQGTSNNSRFRRFVLAERAGCDARAKASPSSGTVFDAWRATAAPLHDATRTPPVSALKRTQPPPD